MNRTKVTRGAPRTRMPGAPHRPPARSWIVEYHRPGRIERPGRSRVEDVEDLARGEIETQRVPHVRQRALVRGAGAPQVHEVEACLTSVGYRHDEVPREVAGATGEEAGGPTDGCCLLERVCQPDQ